ncbi:MAG: TfoX/Sxy family protein [Ramlibacter sp.]
MATELSFVDYILETARLGERLTYKRLFGEYALYLDEKVVAFACDNSLFIKPSRAVASLAPELPQGPPYSGAKDYPIADALLDERDLLRRVIE